MQNKETIAVVTPPFKGHSNTLEEMIRKYHNQFNFELTVTGWPNVPFHPESTTNKFNILEKSNLDTADPALWTLERANALLPCMVKLFRETKPKLVIYDFFSIEAKFAADLMEIPAWCSDPAFIGPYKNQEFIKTKLSNPKNQEALDELWRKFRIELDPKQIEGLSDGFLIPGEQNLVWSYFPIIPVDFKEGRQDLPYNVVGNLRAQRQAEFKRKNDTPVVYFSFGTVVMGNLWDQNPEVKEKLRKYIGALAKNLEHVNVKVIFATQGKNILTAYPDNWEIHDYVDQIKILKSTDVFLTHMGNNSFQEAAKIGVPMVGIPFFGDQIAAAKRMAELGLGKNLSQTTDLDTSKDYGFLNHIFAQETAHAIMEVLRNNIYLENFKKTKLTYDSLHGLLTSQIYLGKPIQFEYTEKPPVTKPIPWNRGDLLYGTQKARVNATDWGGLEPEVHFLTIKPFSEYAPRTDTLPGLIDSYRDVINNKSFWAVDMSSEMSQYQKVLQAYRDFLNGEDDVSKMCIKGLDFFGELFGVRFLMDYFNPAENAITAQEMLHVLQHEQQFQGKVNFYKEVDNGWEKIDFHAVHKILTEAKVDVPLAITDDDKIHEILKKGVYVTSNKDIKKDATHLAILEVHPDIDFTVTGIMPKMKVNEQLVDIEETVFETIHRLLSLKKELDATNTQYGVIVSTCNGIKQIGEDWHDVAVVVIMDINGRTSIAQSELFPFPREFVNIARKRGFEKVTIGSIIAEYAYRHGATKPDLNQDAESYLSDGKISRKDILRNAIHRAFIQLNTT
jgi:MGT family glycosyltransferase